MHVVQEGLEELYVRVGADVMPIKAVEPTSVDDSRLDPERSTSVRRDLKVALTKNPSIRSRYFGVFEIALLRFWLLSKESINAATLMLRLRPH